MKARNLGLVVAAFTVVLFLPLAVRVDDNKSIAQPLADHDAKANPVAEETQPSIIMFSRNGCPPCDRWQAECESALVDAGWNVVVTKKPFNGGTPFFVVTIDGKKYTKSGYKSRADFMNWLRMISGIPIPKAEPATEDACVGGSCKPSRRVFGRPNLIRRNR